MGMYSPGIRAAPPRSRRATSPQTSAKGLAATLAVNQINGGTRAFILGSTARAVNVTLAATDGAFIDATSDIAVYTESPKDTLLARRRASHFATWRSGSPLALNFIGWQVPNAGQLALAAIDAVIGTSFAGTEQPLETLAHIRDSSAAATGDMAVTATAAEQINSTVSNSAQTTNAGIFGANTTAADVIVSSNRVSSTAKAFIDRTGTTVPTTDPTVTVTGALTILAHDDSGIFSNAKLVASAITTNDGGTHLLGNALDGTPSHDLTSSQGTQTLTFGTKVLIDKGFDAPSFTAGGRAPAITSVAPGYVVSLGDAYGVPTLTSNDGFPAPQPRRRRPVSPTTGPRRQSGRDLRVRRAEPAHGSRQHRLLGHDAVGASRRHAGRDLHPTWAPPCRSTSTRSTTATPSQWPRRCGEAGTVYQWMA